MPFILKPQKLYRYTSNFNRPVFSKPDPHGYMASENTYAAFHKEWKYTHSGIAPSEKPKLLLRLKKEMIFMPIQSRLYDNNRWTKIFVGEEMGWIKINHEDSCIIFEEVTSSP